MPVLQYTRVWIKQHPIAATVAASFVLHGIVFAVIGMQTLGGGSSNTEYVMIDLIEPDIPADKVIVEQKLKLIKPIVKVDLENVAANKPAATAPGRRDEIGETNADFGDQAPIQLAMLKAGMQSNTILKHTDAIDFDESLFILPSKGSADQILLATARSDNGFGTGPGFLPGGVGIGSPSFGTGGTNGPVCK